MFFFSFLSVICNDNVAGIQKNIKNSAILGIGFKKKKRKKNQYLRQVFLIRFFLLGFSYFLFSRIFWSFSIGSFSRQIEEKTTLLLS